MIKEYENTLHMKLDREVLSNIKDGLWSKDFGCMEFMRCAARSCDFDDVDDVIIINEKYVITADDMDDSFDVLASGRVLIIPECENIDEYKDWWK